MSFASFSVTVMAKQSSHYQNYPFAVGILASTAGDLLKLTYDVGYDLMVGKDFSVTVEE